MKSLKIAALVLAALVLPGLLAGATYLLTASSLESPAGAVVQVRRAIATPNPDRGRARDTEPGEDISGPCDEAEHADDPRCTGASGSDSEDNSGPGSDDSDEDNSGSGSDDSDNSGPGSDNSGPGSDNSGSGSSGGDD